MPLRFLTAGESHGPALTTILDGLPAGLPLQTAWINQDLARRQHGYGAGPRMKIETDTAQILGGVMEGMTTGAPVALQIANSDHVKWRGKAIQAFTNPRPGHADLTGAVKYGYTDLRPALERASARETAARVAAGSVCRRLLAEFGIQVGGYVVSIGAIRADLSAIPMEDRIRLALESDVSCPEPAAAAQMQQAIREIMTARDTLGGVIEIAALGLPPGLGSFMQWDRRLEARIGAAVLSVQAIKGVEFGPAFENAQLPGTKAHDPIRLDGDTLVRPTNRSGGLEGGITTGQPLLVRAAMKPIATTLTSQQSVNLAAKSAEDTRYERSDFCPVPRAVVILESMVAFILADALMEKLGGDSLVEMRPRFELLRQARLSDLPVEAGEHVFWPAE
jgi:chorismate synthase